MDDDDFLQPNVLQKCRYFLSGSQNSSCCGVFTGYYELDESAENRNVSQLPVKNLAINYSRELQLEGKTVPDQFMLYRTTAARKSLSIPSKFFAAREFVTDLIAGYALALGDWRRLYEPLYVKRKRSSSLTSQQSTELRTVIYKHLSDQFTRKDPKSPISI